MEVAVMEVLRVAVAVVEEAEASVAATKAEVKAQGHSEMAVEEATALVDREAAEVEEGLGRGWLVVAMREAAAAAVAARVEEAALVELVGMVVVWGRSMEEQPVANWAAAHEAVAVDAVAASKEVKVVGGVEVMAAEGMAVEMALVKAVVALAERLVALVAALVGGVQAVVREAPGAMEDITAVQGGKAAEEDALAVMAVVDAEVMVDTR